jgi:ketosteroid isomerase-like protein
VSGENIELVRRLYEAWNRGETRIDAWAEDGEVWTVPGFLEGGLFKGRDQIRRFVDGLREGWKPGSDVVEIREIEEVGDKVLASIEWRAIGNVSGLESSSEWMIVYTIRDGQIARLEFFYDRDAAVRAAGLK